MGAAMSFFLGGNSYALESPSDGAVALATQWQRKLEDFPAYRVPPTQGGLLRQESLDLFKAYVAQCASGHMWEWAKALLESVGAL
jgi:hypothetical protein